MVIILSKSGFDKLSEKKLVCLRDVSLFRQYSMKRIARGGSPFLRIFPAVAAVLALILSGCGKRIENPDPPDILTETHMTNRGIVDDVFWVTTVSESDSETEEKTAKNEPVLFTGQVNNLEGVTMEVLNVDSSVITVELTNGTDLNIIYGEDYQIQTMIDDEWYSLPTVENVLFPMIAYSLEKDVPAEMSEDLQILYGVLEPGSYRIVKSVEDSREGYSVNYCLAAEFTIE